jgi:hypothetical protein
MEIGYRGQDGRVRVQLQVQGDPEEVSSLHEWLEQERAVRTDGDLRWARSESPEHQGVDMDVLSLAVTSTLTVTQLVLQILTQWRQSRPRHPVVTITQELPNGTVVRLDTFDPDALAEAVRKLENG